VVTSVFLEPRSRARVNFVPVVVVEEDKEQRYVRADDTLSGLMIPREMKSSMILPRSLVALQACPCEFCVAKVVRVVPPPPPDEGR
jgi:hypothetical protein